MTQTESWTVGRLLTWTTDYLKRSGSESPRLDAEVLLAAARKCERIMLYTAFQDIVPDDVRAEFRELVKRRAAGVPVAYLVGRKEFFSLIFRVSPDVLVPRPETEYVVLAALDALKQRPAGSPPPCIADVGTGSGAIAVAIAKHAPNCCLVATDISPAALAIARQNALDHGVADRMDFFEGDLLSMTPAENQWDIIASNPPYIGEQETGTLAENVLKHEPRIALFGGPTGTEIIARLIPQAATRLRLGGRLILEVSPLIAAQVASLIAADGHFEQATITKDLAGLERVITARRL